jgi:hypothetical protein
MGQPDRWIALFRACVVERDFAAVDFQRLRRVVRIEIGFNGSG